MSPISARLLLLAAVSTLVAIAGLAVAWSRMRGWWRVARVGGVIMCQLLIVFTVGVAVNRTEDFYPSWAALRGANPPRITATTAPTARLATWLRTQQARGLRSGLQFAWRSADDAAWGLGAPTVVYLPRAYFQTQDVDLPVVMILVGSTVDAKARTDLAAATASGQAVVVVMQPGPHGPDLAAIQQVPALLADDVRVERGGWAMVGTAAAVTPAITLFREHPNDFGVLALVSAPHPSAGLGAAAQAAADGRPLLVAASGKVVGSLPWIEGELPPALRPPLVVGAALSSVTTPKPAQA